MDGKNENGGSGKTGKRTAIRFEGVYMDSRTYVNGVLAGEWNCGYSTFEFDITGILKAGENEITVCVDYKEPNSRWYSGAGRLIGLDNGDSTDYEQYKGISRRMFCGKLL